MLVEPTTPAARLAAARERVERLAGTTDWYVDPGPYVDPGYLSRLYIKDAADTIIAEIDLDLSEIDGVFHPGRSAGDVADFIADARQDVPALVGLGGTLLDLLEELVRDPTAGVKWDGGSYCDHCRFDAVAYTHESTCVYSRARAVLAGTAGGAP